MTFCIILSGSFKISFFFSDFLFAACFVWLFKPTLGAFHSIKKFWFGFPEIFQSRMVQPFPNLSELKKTWGTYRLDKNIREVKWNSNFPESHFGIQDVFRYRTPFCSGLNGTTETIPFPLSFSRKQFTRNRIVDGKLHLSRLVCWFWKNPDRYPSKYVQG